MSAGDLGPQWPCRVIVDGASEALFEPSSIHPSAKHLPSPEKIFRTSSETVVQIPYSSTSANALYIFS